MNPTTFRKKGVSLLNTFLYYFFLIHSDFAPSFTPLGVCGMHTPVTGAVVQPNHFWFSVKVGWLHARLNSF